MHSGDDFSHTQQQKNGAVKGTYKVQLPDGRTQVVRYMQTEHFTKQNEKCKQKQQLLVLVCELFKKFEQSY